MGRKYCALTPLRGPKLSEQSCKSLLRRRSQRHNDYRSELRHRHLFKKRTPTRMMLSPSTRRRREGPSTERRREKTFDGMSVGKPSTERRRESTSDGTSVGKPSTERRGNRNPSMEHQEVKRPSTGSRPGKPSTERRRATMSKTIGMRLRAVENGRKKPLNLGGRLVMIEVGKGGDLMKRGEQIMLNLREPKALLMFGYPKMRMQNTRGMKVNTSGCRLLMADRTSGSRRTTKQTVTRLR